MTEMKMTCGALLTPKYDSYSLFKGDGRTAARLPERYECADTLDVYDQGRDGACVSCAVTEMMCLHDRQRGIEPSVDFTELFRRRRDKTINGMDPVEAFEMLKSDGRIKAYARMNSAPALRQSIVTHGAAMAVLHVGSYGDSFWHGTSDFGYHAVAVTGYEEGGFHIKNSWGRAWGDGGYTFLPLEELGCVLELWTILS